MNENKEKMIASVIENEETWLHQWIEIKKNESIHEWKLRTVNEN